MRNDLLFIRNEENVAVNSIFVLIFVVQKAADVDVRTTTTSFRRRTTFYSSRRRGAGGRCGRCESGRRSGKSDSYSREKHSSLLWWQSDITQ